MTETELAKALGVSTRTIRNAKRKGFSPEKTGDGRVDVNASIKAYVDYQSRRIRELSAAKGRQESGISQMGDPEEDTGINWKEEKDKQAAIKGRLANQQAVGELIPAEAMLELYNSPLSLVQSKLLCLPDEIQKRVRIDPATSKAIEDVVRDALRRLREKSADELQSVIQQIIERYSQYYRAAGEEGDSNLGN